MNVKKSVKNINQLKSENEWHSINTRLIEREDMKIEENYIEKMCNEIARIVTEAIQKLYSYLTQYEDK